MSRGASCTIKKNLFSCCHIALEMYSRMIRAFSRADARQDMMEFGYSSSNVRNCVTLSRVAMPS
jgi:hypothetical protein